MMERASAPILCGDHYCSNWCGFGCTLAAYERAVKEADELAVRLGEGWRPVVWENAGWNYEARNGEHRISVFRRGGGLTGDWEVLSYSAWIQGGTSENRIQIIERAETPEDALGFATQKARTVVSNLTDNLNAMLEGLPA